MGILINQDGDRSKLQERLAAELREKAQRKAKLDEAERPDGITDSAYLKDTQASSSLTWVWVLIALFVIVGAIILIINLG